MSGTDRAQILIWLRDENSETQAMGLRSIQKSAIDIETFWSEFPRLLRAPNTDVRWLAANLLREKAYGRDIGAFIPHLESLVDDLNKPSWLKFIGGDGCDVGAVARAAVAHYYVHHRKTDRLRALIAKGGLSAFSALDALRCANDADLITPLLPDLAEAQRRSDQKLRWRAAAALAHYYLLDKRWDQVPVLLFSDDEAVRLGIIAKLDDLADGGQDIEPFLPGLLSIFEQSDDSFRRTREAAARVLTWLVLQRHTVKENGFGVPKSFILNSMDIVTIPEVKVQLEKLQRSTQEAADKSGSSFN